MKRTRLAWIALLGLILLLGILPSLTVRADFGSNWSVQFYTDTNWTTLCTNPNCNLTGVPQVNFNWGTGQPVVNNITVPVGPDNFSARFTSNQIFTPGIYQFTAQSDDGIRVTVNGAVIIDHLQPHAVATDNATVSISTTSVLITVDYFEGPDQAVVQLQWFLQSASATNIFGFTATPLATAVPPLTVSVENVRGLSLRSGPYLGASLISAVRPGAEYPPIARNTDEGQFTWYLITVDTHTGWASGRYLAITGDPNAAPLQGTVFDTIDNAPDVAVIGVTRSVMNFRRRPSARTALIEQIPWGAEVPIVGRTIQGGKNFWFQVRYNNRVGWIFAPFVSVRGNINNVPIR